MSTSKHIDKICIAAVCLMLVLTILFMCGGSLGISSAVRTVKYENTLFDTSYVHRIDIVMDDWDSFIENCENEEYSSCTAVIDGDQYKNIAIRAKGNTSLSNVRSLGSQRYSFKLEFDHYEDGKSCDGLDKLCLNNLIQDNTMMKDYIVYQMMNDFGVNSPLCSFAYITVNGEDWGLYLAVEAIEDSFLKRNYGTDFGELYKPDSMSFGGGRGNGKEFNMDDFDFDSDSFDLENQGETVTDNEQSDTDKLQAPNGFGGRNMPQDRNAEIPEGFTPGRQIRSDIKSGNQTPEESSDAPDISRDKDNQFANFPQSGEFGEENIFQKPGGFGSRGSEDVKLQYIDDAPDSYPNIFDNAKTNISDADKTRLISSLKDLSDFNNLENTLDIDNVLRYFIVHSFVVNGDSYTGNMIHNYYLHEKGGKLDMIPWDYNLAFGTFQGGSASNSVNDSIDEVLSDRPMQAWIFSDETYTEQYHTLYAEFIKKWFDNSELEKLIADTSEMLRPYVKKDPTKFCTEEEFDTGVQTMKQFVALRAEAVNRQLADDTTAVETGSINLSDMGSMGGSVRNGMENRKAMEGQNRADSTVPEMPKEYGQPGKNNTALSEIPEGFPKDFDGEIPVGQNGTPPGIPDKDNQDRTQNPVGEQINESSGTDRGLKDNNKFSDSNTEKINNSSGQMICIMLAVSLAVLIIGLLIAIKKKY